MILPALKDQRVLAEGKLCAMLPFFQIALPDILALRNALVLLLPSCQQMAACSELGRQIPVGK